MLKIGEVFVPDDEDFQRFKTECINDQGWTIRYDKSSCRVSTKKNSLSMFDMIRIQTDFNGISGELLYNVLQDGTFRSQWDTGMLESFEICSVSLNSDIGYYCLKSPTPFKNRDFVTQRSWLDLGPDGEKYIINHSVNHLKMPPKKNCVRGISYLTGYFIVPRGKTSCTFYYLTQCDPGGNLPVWLVNTLSRVFIPKVMKKLEKACGKYEKWKSKNNPNYMPWLNPEQVQVPRYKPDEIGQLDVKETLIVSETTSEATVSENSIQVENYVTDD